MQCLNFAALILEDSRYAGIYFENKRNSELQLPSFSPLLSRNALFELALFFLNSRLRVQQVVELCRDEGDEQDRGGTEDHIPDVEVVQVPDL